MGERMTRAGRRTAQILAVGSFAFGVWTVAEVANTAWESHDLRAEALGAIWNGVSDRPVPDILLEASEYDDATNLSLAKAAAAFGATFALMQVNARWESDDNQNQPSRVEWLDRRMDRLS